MAVRPRCGISGVPKELARPAGLEPTTPRLGISGHRGLTICRALLFLEHICGQQWHSNAKARRNQ